MEFNQNIEINIIKSNDKRDNAWDDDEKRK